MVRRWTRGPRHDRVRMPLDSSFREAALFLVFYGMVVVLVLALGDGSRSGDAIIGTAIALAYLQVVLAFGKGSLRFYIAGYAIGFAIGFVVVSVFGGKSTPEPFFFVLAAVFTLPAVREMRRQRRIRADAATV